MTEVEGEAARLSRRCGVIDFELGFVFCRLFAVVETGDGTLDAPAALPEQRDPFRSSDVGD